MNTQGRTGRQLLKISKALPYKALSYHPLSGVASGQCSQIQGRKKTPTYTFTAKYGAKKDASASVNVTMGKTKISVSPGAFLIAIKSASMARGDKSWVNSVLWCLKHQAKAHALAGCFALKESEVKQLATHQSLTLGCVASCDTAERVGKLLSIGVLPSPWATLSVPSLGYETTEPVRQRESFRILLKKPSDHHPFCLVLHS